MKSCNIGSHMSGNKLLAGQKNRNRLIAIIVSMVGVPAVFGQYNIYGYLWDDVCNCDFSFYDNSERVRYKTVSVTKYSSYNLGDYSLSDSHRDASPLISLYLLGRFLLHDC